MSNVHHVIKADTPTVPEYRALVETPYGRMLMPTKCFVHVLVTGDPGLAEVFLDVELIDRRYVITRLLATPPPGGGLDIETVRALDTASYIRRGVANRIIMESSDGQTYTAEQPMESPNPLWPVATAYAVAHALGEPPTMAVARDLRISQAAAAQRVKRAREAGFLPATRRGARS
jgi:hypothetical protein